MKVILVDDEPMMHLIMGKMLDKLPGVEVAGAFVNTKQAAAFLNENDDIGLAFVDISMPGETGMAFAAKLEQARSPMQIVFVTSHKEFALDAYELSVTDYLVKPVSQERLERTVNRVLAIRTAHVASQERAVSAAPRLIITTLGDVSIGSETLRVKWISRKCAELFAYLLLHRGKRIPRSRLVADIFGGMHLENAENYLNTTVYQLRKSLQPLGLRENIRSENDGYALELPQGAFIDYAEFEQQALALQSIDAGNVEEAMQAERLYTGDLFGDKAYVWAIHETERYAELYEAFVIRMTGVLIAMNNTASASKLLSKLNERNPLDETVIRLLMEVRGMTGDRKGLTALYTGYVRLLSRELGIRPSEELTGYYNGLTARFFEK
ncbi:response regulator [Paenibacillus glycanilyticus]|uniref:response regulator n=1 Tax=Paenibacillus glycanilyticus TaxID=126569 RepID=UPI00203D4E1E|nr:response regulator [Paenibacillus glycanilyticus]MCM3628711.1 response regulator [Paenibacillus glycanilyticus]